MRDEDKTRKQLMDELVEARRRIAELGTLVAKHKQAEEILRSSEEKYRYIAENPVDGVAMLQDGRTIYVNNAFCKIFGYEKEEFVGEGLLKVVDPEDHTMLEERSRKGFVEGERAPKPYVAGCVKKGGKKLFIEISVSDPFTYRGMPATVVIFRDITEKRRIEEEILKIQKLESVGILAGGIAHDFNNILTGILGNISLARIYKDPDRIAERLIEAEKASLRARDLTQQLLTFSKGGAPVKLPSSITDILRDSVSFALTGSNVICEFSIPDDLWSVEIDEGQMNQVISNLIINAGQSMPDGGIIGVRAENMIVEAEDALSLEGGKYVGISIQDQGIGIPEDDLQKIFDPYFTTKQNGSGLGLAISYSIVKNHDGYITVESLEGVGTTFRIYLPASQGKRLIQKKNSEETPMVGKGKILVMDDEEIVRELVANILTGIGYEVIVAEDGMEAIRLFKEARELSDPFDAVIVDLTVRGGMGGKEVIQRFIEIDPKVKTIVSSGYSNDPVMADFRKYGFRDVITKPYRNKELSEVLHRVMTMDEKTES